MNRIGNEDLLHALLPARSWLWGGPPRKIILVVVSPFASATAVISCVVLAVLLDNGFRIVVALLDIQKYVRDLRPVLCLSARVPDCDRRYYTRAEAISVLGEKNRSATDHRGCNQKVVSSCTDWQREARLRSKTQLELRIEAGLDHL